jgi:DNA-binding protein H-NS
MIRQMVEFWRITPEELDSPLEEVEKPVANLPPKYRHPVTGETWDGQGPHPDWLRKALLNDGYTVSELRVSEQKPQT